MPVTWGRQAMRRVLALAVLTGLHLALSLGLLFSSHAATMRRINLLEGHILNDGLAGQAGAWERVIETAGYVLRFPLANLPDFVFRGPRSLSTVHQYLDFLANSL